MGKLKLFRWSGVFINAPLREALGQRQSQNQGRVYVVAPTKTKAAAWLGALTWWSVRPEDLVVAHDVYALAMGEADLIAEEGATFLLRQNPVFTSPVLRLIDSAAYLVVGTVQSTPGEGHQTMIKVNEQTKKGHG